MKELQPLNEHILLDLNEEDTEQKTASGIIIPDSAKEKTQEGTIQAVGEAEDMPVKEGDHVIFESFAGTEINVDEEKYLIMEKKDILAVLE